MDRLDSFARASAEVGAKYGAAKRVAADTASARVELTSTHISITAITAAARFAIGDETVEASATSHYIGLGERLILSVPAGSHLAAIKVGSAGVIEISEIS